MRRRGLEPPPTNVDQALTWSPGCHIRPMRPYRPERPGIWTHRTQWTIWMLPRMLPRTRSLVIRPPWRGGPARCRRSPSRLHVIRGCRDRQVERIGFAVSARRRRVAVDAAGHALRVACGSTGAGDGVVCGGEGGAEEVEFEVAVVLFGGGDGAVAELAGDEDEVVSGVQPTCRGRSPGGRTRPACWRTLRRRGTTSRTGSAGTSS